MSKATDPIHPVIKSALGIGTHWQATYEHTGISLRDHIAIEAMKAILSRETLGASEAFSRGIASLAYSISDAMISVSQKP